MAARWCTWHDAQQVMGEVYASHRRLAQSHTASSHFLESQSINDSCTGGAEREEPTIGPRTFFNLEPVEAPGNEASSPDWRWRVGFLQDSAHLGPFWCRLSTDKAQ